MAAPGTFTTLSANSTVTFSLGAVSGYYWTCANGSGDGLWAAFPSTSTFSTVNLTAGATLGYIWKCTNAGTGAGGWASVTSLFTGSALSVSNDTNITATFTGTNSTALLNAVTINLAWANTLAVSRGGTNYNGASLTLGDLLYAANSTTFARLPGNTTGNTRKFLVSTASGGVATAPTWDYLTGADLSGVSMNFSSIGFAMTPPSNAYISTTSRTGIAGANYQVSLGGTYTAISSSTSIIDLDITTTHVSTTSALTTSAGLQITPNTNATSGGITSNYGILIGAGTNGGGTVTTNYGIYNTVQTTGSTNYGYYQTGTFTKANDVGLQLINTFTPTATANIRQLIVNPTFNTTSAILTSAYGYLGQTVFTTSTNNSTTLAEKYLNPTFTVSGAGIVTTAVVCYVNPSINITTATTGTRVTNMYGMLVQIAASPTITTASTVLGTYYNIYSGTSPSLTGSGKFGTVCGGYFAAPLTTTTDANTGSVALWADSLQVGGAVSGSAPSGTIKMTTYAFRFLALAGLTLTNGNPIPYSVVDTNFPYQTITSNGFRAPVAGIYMFTVGLALDNSGTSTSYRAILYRQATLATTNITFAGYTSLNIFNALFPLHQEQYNSVICTINGSCVVHLDLNDYVQVFATASSTVTLKTYSWGNFNNVLSGFLLSRD